MKQLTLILLTGAMLLASCSREEATPVGEGTATDAPLVALNLSGLALDVQTQAPQSRAAEPVDIATNKNIGFFVKGNANYSAQNNVQGVYATSFKGWWPKDSIWLNSNDATLCVYYPYASGQGTPTLNLTAQLYPADDSGDLSYARFTANCRYTDNAGKLDIVLKPIYSRLLLSVVRDDTYPAAVAPKLTGVALSGVDLFRNGTVHMETDAYTRTTATPTFTFAGKDVGKAGAPATVDLLLVPNALTANVTVTLTVNGRAAAVAIDKQLFNYSLERGKKYTATLRLLSDDLKVVAVDVADWTNASAGSSDGTLN